jgi:hypothetical protein
MRKQKLQMAALSKLPAMRKSFKILQRQLAALQQQLDAGDEPVDAATKDQAA